MKEHIFITLLVGLALMPQQGSCITWEANQIIIETIRALEWSSIEDTIIPIYRMDLNVNYVAYYLLTNRNEYVITSAGSRTGDQDIAQQGELPAPTTKMDKDAKKDGSKCVRYLKLSPGGELACEDDQGTIVATTVDRKMIELNMKQGQFETMDAYIKNMAPVLADQWAGHAMEPRDNEPDDPDDHGTGATRSVRDEEPVHDTAPETPEATDPDVFAISPDAAVQIAMDDEAEVTKMFLKFVPATNNTPSQEEVTAMEVRLCRAIAGCELKDSEATLPASAIKIHAVTGISYLEVDLTEDAQIILDNEEPAFSIHIEAGEASFSRTYGVYFPPQNSKRSLFQPWTSFIYRGIGHSWTFPHYKQQNYQGCQVGSVNVAWAMIFGYFDRRSHLIGLFPIYQGSKPLYRSGWNGFFGSPNQVAPSTVDNRMRNYIRGLHGITDTTCVNGKPFTPLSKINDVKSFFNARQDWLGPGFDSVFIGESLTFWSIMGWHNSAAAKVARRGLAEDVPVLIGYNKAWLGGRHYPVVIRYRFRYRLYKICVNGMPTGNWKWQFQYAMLLNMGKAGLQNGWYSMQAFYAAYGQYYHFET